MREIKTLLSELTIREKAALLEGYQSWMTNAVPRLDIPSVYLTDGPIGVRKKMQAAGEGVMGLGSAYPSTAFPTSVSIANSWNVENARKMGEAIGEECVCYDVDVLLGPALNLKRDPRCGRNFEYYSEDPLLAGKLAAAFTAGVQSTGTAACPKHFALNNSENFRYMGDSVVDERAARELYLKPFEICVKESHPRTMMCSYNKVNGTHASENKWLLTDVLRQEWGFDGLVMSDWGAVRDRVAGVKAGLDLDMPGGVWANRRAIVEAAESGELSTEELDRAVTNVLKLVEDALKCREERGKKAENFGGETGQTASSQSEVSDDQKADRNKSQKIDQLLRDHDELAARMAEDCAVLLKNEGVLPLNRDKRVLVVGELFETMRYQGAGSSRISPRYLTSPKEAFDRAGETYIYAKGYQESIDRADEKLEEEAIREAKFAQVILFFGGLTETAESEGFDRADLAIPMNQLRLMEKLAKMGKPIVTVLFGGSPMELSFHEQSAAILNLFLPGQNGGEACRRLLYGEANPGGKLSETWMRRCNDLAYSAQYSKRKVETYRENIYVGYRFFDLVPERILYPFGHGLSYTRFEYSDLKITEDNGRVTATLTVANVGERDGAEIVQLYVGKNKSSQVFKAEKELKAFAKIYLKAGEKQRVTLEFALTDLAYYHNKHHQWVLENGDYPILVGTSSRDIRLAGEISVEGQPEVEPPYSGEVMEAYGNITNRSVLDDVFSQTIGRPVPADPKAFPFTIESPINDFKAGDLGRFLYSKLLWGISKSGDKFDKLPDGPEKTALKKNLQFTKALIPRNCPRSLVQSAGGGMVQMKLAHAITAFANNEVAKSIWLLIKPERKIPLPIEEWEKRKPASKK